jgi:YbgC/YbaW family acyl-CoA thioester hydrolase
MRWNFYHQLKELLMELSTLPKELESTYTIRFQDCDPFGHLNNARYADYFLNARYDQLLADYDVDLFKPGQTENWVVSKSQIAYLLPAAMGETVRIRTRLIYVTDRTLLIEGVMLNAEGTRLKSALWMEFTHVSLTSGRPVNHGPEWMDLFHAVVIEGPAEVGFDARVEALRMQYRKRSDASQPEAVAA